MSTRGSYRPRPARAIYQPGDWSLHLEVVRPQGDRGEPDPTEVVEFTLRKPNQFGGGVSAITIRLDEQELTMMMHKLFDTLANLQARRSR